MTSFSSSNLVRNQPRSVRETNRSLLEQIAVYRRDPAFIGNDIFIEPLGDITTNSTGDLETITGVESIVHSLLRRVTTPIDGFSRWIRTANGLTAIDDDYGNGAYSFLSTPLISSSPDAIEQAIYVAAEAEQRIRIVKVVTESNYRDSVRVQLDYRIIGNNDLQTLGATLFGRLEN